MVIGMRARIRLDTLSLKKKLLPRSPTAARPIQFTNWTIERLVEAVGLADDLDVLLRRAGAGDRDGKVARQARQHERKRHDCQRDEQTKSGTTQNEADHRRRHSKVTTA